MVAQAVSPANGAARAIFRSRLDVRKHFQLTVTVAQMLRRNTHLVQDCQMQICQWETCGHLEMPASLNESATPARYRNRQIPGRVCVAIAHARAINNERIVQK